MKSKTIYENQVIIHSQVFECTCAGHHTKDEMMNTGTTLCFRKWHDSWFDRGGVRTHGAQGQEVPVDE